MPSFRYSTAAQLRQRVRQAFQQERGERLHRIARWMDQNLTDAQLKAAFGLTDPQTAALRSKIQTMRARIEALDAEAGQ